MNRLRLALLGLAAVAALVLGAGFLQRAFHGTHAAVEMQVPAQAALTPSVPQEPPAVIATRQKIEAEITGSPDYTRFFDRLRLLFPSDYDTVLNAVARGANGAAGLPSLDAVMADAVGILRKADGSLAAKASDEALAQIFVLQLEEMRALAQRDVHLCVAFLSGATGSGFLGFAADHRALIANAAIAGLDAMNSGRTDQVTRPAPPDADFQTLDRALTQKGLTRPEIEALLDGKTADPPIADEQMCTAGQSYLETLAGIAPDARSRLYGLAVDLLAKS